jgi:hypothetical protein
MESPFDLLPNIAGNKLPFEPYPGATSIIGQIFRNTDTTYKFFWFLSLLAGSRAINLAKSDAVPNLSRYLAVFVDQHYAAMPVLESALTNVRGKQLKALEAITLEYATFFKIPLSELFLLSRDRYTDVLSTELHAQADVARRLNFQTEWIWV